MSIEPIDEDLIPELSPEEIREIVRARTFRKSRTQLWVTSIGFVICFALGYIAPLFHFLLIILMFLMISAANGIWANRKR